VFAWGLGRLEASSSTAGFGPDPGDPSGFALLLLIPVHRLVRLKLKRSLSTPAYNLAHLFGSAEEGVIVKLATSSALVAACTGCLIQHVYNLS
jgi:hypothetical protein